MRRETNIPSFLLAATSFLGGVAVGLLLSPRSGDQNRSMLRKNASRLAEWMDNQRKTARDTSSKELQKFRQNVQQGIRRNVPDLYEATEDIELSNNDILIE